MPVFSSIRMQQLGSH